MTAKPTPKPADEKVVPMNRAARRRAPKIVQPKPAPIDLDAEDRAMMAQLVMSQDAFKIHASALMKGMGDRNPRRLVITGAKMVFVEQTPED